MESARTFAIICALAASSTATAEPSPEEQVRHIMDGLDTTVRGPSQAGAKDCDKAAKDADKALDTKSDDPLGAIKASAAVACSYLEQIAWKPPSVKAAPAASGGKDAPTSDDITARASYFWKGSDDRFHVKALSGGASGAWQTMEFANAPGVPSSRWIKVHHVIVAGLAKDAVGCFVVYGALEEKNLNHPDHVAPRWSLADYKATDWKRAEKVACPKGAKPPKPPKPGE